MARIEFESFLTSSIFSRTQAQIGPRRGSHPAVRQVQGQYRWLGMASAAAAYDLRQPRRCSFALGSHGSRGGALKRSAIASVNHQHLWLLATAHEALERYVVRLYA